MQCVKSFCLCNGAASKIDFINFNNNNDDNVKTSSCTIVERILTRGHNGTRMLYHCSGETIAAPGAILQPQLGSKQDQLYKFQ